MNRAIAALVPCLCMAGTAWTGELPDSAAIHGSIGANDHLSPLPDTNSAVLLMAGQTGMEEPRLTVNPCPGREVVRQFITGIDRMHDQFPRWGTKMDFAPIEWRSLQDDQGAHAAGSVQMKNWPVLQDAAVIMPPLVDAYRSTDRWLKGGDGRSSDVQAHVGYTERKNGEGRLREIDLPFPTLLWLLGVVLIAMATISRRNRPD